MSQEILIRKDGSSAIENSAANGIALGAIEHIVKQHVLLRHEGYHTAEVSSGAVLAAKGLLASRGLEANNYSPKVQAMMGISEHFHMFQKVAGDYGLVVASSLTTEIELANEGREIRGGMGEALAHDEVLLVSNFHDEASSIEMRQYLRRFRPRHADSVVLQTESAENDFHSVHIAMATGAAVLMLCTGADGFRYRGKKLDVIHVDDIPGLLQYCEGGSRNGTGDMRTKLQAAKKAAEFGIKVVIGNFAEDSRRILEDNMGTWVVQ